MTLDDRYIDSSSWLGSYTAVEDLLSDTLMASGIKWCPVIDELLYEYISTYRLTFSVNYTRESKNQIGMA